MKQFILLFATIAPMMADVEFRARPMVRDEAPFGKGQCDIRLQIDKEAEVRVHGDLVSVRTVSGREARDDGSECSEPLPGPGLEAFNFEVRDSRGQIVLVSPPFERNGYTAVVRIRDSASGAGRYHFRLSWRISGRGPDMPGPPRGNPFGVDQAIQVCRDGVVSRLVEQYGYREVKIRSIRADDRPGRRDYVLGEASARGGSRGSTFTFVCSVDFDSGRVRSVDMKKR